MKIVILDSDRENPGDLSWEGIEMLGSTVIYDSTPYDEDIIIERLANADIAVTNKTPLTEHVIANSPSLKYVTVLATGYNIVDTAAAGKRGIIVSNVPSYGTDSVAEFAVSLLLELCHHVGHHSDLVRSGMWEREGRWCFWDSEQIELRGKTMEIIGMGRIGRRVADIASALKMNVITSSAHRKDDTPYRFVDLDELFRQSDVISLHCPLTPETEEIINRSTIEKMKDGVLIINNSRGGLVNEKDLRDALISGKVKGAAVDVVSSEPVSSSNPLLTAPNCIITPHISWAAKEARERIMRTTEENIRSFIEGRPQNTVN